MNNDIKSIQISIEPLRKQIINHPVYASINDLEDLKIFMQYHIYAVWDFMSLLKALQINLTCVTLPWFPIGSGTTRSLINEIVAGEESDVDSEGNKKSHFEMYLDAMDQLGADTSQIKQFLAELQSSGDFDAAYKNSNTPAEAINFVDYTFEIINSKESHLQASVFTFGREDLIPNMFYTLVNDLDHKFPGQISKLKYYLDRHIEVDGDHHSLLALEMIAELCNADEAKIKAAEQAALEALKQRVLLWDGAHQQIRSVLSK